MATGSKNDAVVISGISGRFPECNNMEDLKHNLLNGVDMITEDDRRYPLGLYNLPRRLGKIPHLEHFDASFFGIPAKQAHKIDPQIRILLECTFEALLDAGINPSEVRGTRTGVYAGVCESESAEYWRRDSERADEYGLSGCCRQMFANRIAYVFDFNGPNYVIDAGCASNQVSFHRAIKDIETGECDAAIVATSSICLMPEMTLQFHRMKVLGPDGKCRSYDASRNGYARSETIGVIFLQKASVARRIYATVMGSRVNTDGFKQISIGFPSGAMQERLARDLYNEISIDPADVGYVEGHATGTVVGDVQETKFFTNLYCKNRKGPLLIGSVRSNLGHSEGASGMGSVAKVLIAMESGTIPANLHYEKPPAAIPGLVDGRLKVVATNQPLDNDLMAINSTGVGGINSHMLLRRNLKQKSKSTTSSIPRLLIVSGRTEQAVNHLLNESEKHRNDVEFLALLDKIHSMNIPGHEYRGYSVLGSTTRGIAKVATSKRPIWFVFSGMGSQSAKTVEKLMEIDTFRTSIQNSANTLRQHGFDLEDLLKNADETTFRDVSNLLVCITSVQIALVDVLRSIGIEPDGLIGHSVGEIACAYADGALTAEQTILSAYYRGRSFLQVESIAYAMAVVNLSWEECIERCPPEIIPACHNSKKNITISGPRDNIEKFVELLKSQNIFARVVKGAELASHCKYAAGIAQVLLGYLEKVIPNPKPRSPKWVSSSIPESEWNAPNSQLSSPFYFANNLRSPVLFYKALQHIPKDAIVIEIAPYGIMQPFVQETVGRQVTFLNLTKRDHMDNLNYFLSSIGRLFTFGGQPDVSKLYPPVNFPVGRGTPMISPLVQWDHSVKWTVPDFSQEDKKFEQTITINMAKEEDKYLAGHVIDGAFIFPATGYLTVIWKAFAKHQRRNFEDMPVVMENVEFYRPTIVPNNAPVNFEVSIFEQCKNRFQMYENGSLVVTGTIFTPENPNDQFRQFSRLPQAKEENTSITLSTDEMYKLLDSRGYHYEGLFRGLLTSDGSAYEGTVAWNKNWVAFMDTLLQFSILGINTHSMLLPTGFQRVVINPVLHTQLVSDKTVSVSSYHDFSAIKSGGIEIVGMRLHLARKRPQIDPDLKLTSYSLLPLRNTILSGDNTTSIHQALSLLLQIVWENRGNTSKLKVVEIPGENGPMNSLTTVFENNPQILTNYVVIHLTAKRDVQEENAHLIILNDYAVQDTNILEKSVKALETSGFLLIGGDAAINEDDLNHLGLEIVSVQNCPAGSQCFVLFRKITALTTSPEIIHITGSDFGWFEQVKTAMKSSTKTYLVAQNEEPNGIVGLVNALIHEPGGNGIRSYCIQNKTAEPFNISSPFYAAQVEKDLVHNVLDAEGSWGTYFHVPWQPQEVQVEHSYIVNSMPGNFASLEWVQSPLQYQRPSENTEICTISYAALSFRDLMHVGAPLLPSQFYGNIEEEQYAMGIEFSGRDSSGQRVMGIVSGHGLATTTIANSDLLLKVPEQWSLEEAATVPLAYATCYYALIVQGQMQNGESIIIHIGSEGTELAAVSIALHKGCIIFIIVNNDEQKTLLTNTFSQINSNCIGNSNDPNFEQLVKLQTKGRGVDLVLSSLSENQLLLPLRCLANGGRFLNMGVFNNTTFGMTDLANKSLFNINLEAAIKTNGLLLKRLVTLIEEGIRLGVVKPLPRIVFPKEKIEQALMTMASGKSTGKVLVKICGEENPTPLIFNARPRTYFNPDKTYIVVNGLEDFGVDLTNWIVTRGATKVILAYTKHEQNGYEAYCLKQLKEKHVSVFLHQLDTSTYKDAQELIGNATKLGPVGGIFYIGDDNTDNQRTNRLKINSAKNLDKLTRQLAPELDYFVAFLSVGSGQAIRDFANSTVERICENRRSDGFPALAIQWGNIENCKTGLNGIRSQRVTSCLATLDVFLQQQAPVVSSVIFEKGSESPTVPESNVLDAIADILGTDDTKSLCLTSTLDEYGIDSLMGISIMRVLENQYDIIVSVAKIRFLTFNDLIELTTGTSQGSVKTTDVLVNVEFERMPEDVILEMSSGKTRPIFFIHPIEGHVRMLQTLAKHTAMPVYGLQYTKQCPSSSFAELAEYYIKQVKNVQNKGPYVFLGYSLGAAIAFEMGLQLQAHKENVTLLLVDGSHSTLANLSKTYDQDVVYLIANHFAVLSRDLQRRSVVSNLVSLKTEEEQINKFSQILAKEIPHPFEEIRASVAGVFHRLKAGIGYKPSGKFSGDVTLLRTKKDYIAVEEDYGLASVCTQKVKLYSLDGNHETIVTGSSAVKIAEVVREVMSKLK